jgi:hypothetical protein
VKVRAALFVALIGAAGAIGACNAILGNTTLTAEDGGSADGPVVDGTRPGDGSTDADDAALDAKPEADSFCANLRGRDPHLVFCSDFDDGGEPTSYFHSMEVSSGAELALVVDAASCPFPPCLLASIPPYDGGVLPAAYGVVPLDHDGWALPSYIASDINVSEECLGGKLNGIVLVQLDLGPSAFPPQVYFEARNGHFNLGWYRGFSLDGEAQYGGPSASGNVTFEAGSWVRLWLELSPLEGGSFEITLAQGTAGTYDPPDAAVEDGEGVFLPPDGGIDQAGVGNVRFGLTHGYKDTPSCTVYYDNLAVGHYAGGL